MKRIVKGILILALIALVVIQFIRPEKNVSGYETVAIFERETKPSTKVVGILKENCYDCHSDHTNYPWYSNIAPFSFWLNDHIKHGKGEFSVSNWDEYSLKKKEHKLEDLIEEVKSGHMPLDSYTWIHGDLEADEKQLLLQWAGLARMQYVEQLQLSNKR